MDTNIPVDNVHTTAGMTLPQKLAALEAKRAAAVAARIAQEKEEAAIEQEIAAERKANRATFMNSLLAEIKSKVEAFGDKELFSDLAEELDALAPRASGGPRGPRLSEEAMKTRNAAIVEALKVEGATAESVAKQFNISAGTVNLVKKEAGLTATRKPKAKEVFSVAPIVLGNPTETTQTAEATAS